MERHVRGRSIRLAIGDDSSAPYRLLADQSVDGDSIASSNLDNVASVKRVEGVDVYKQLT